MAAREREAAKQLAEGKPEKVKEEETPDAPDVLGEQEDADVIF